MSKRAKALPGLLTQEVAAILRAAIARKRGVTQGDLAKAADISQTQLSDMLNDKKHMDVEQLDRLCYALGIEFMDVLEEADKKSATRHIEPEWDVKPL